jgi:outer membrane protein OmpA-like peptidoglycan-associated protein
MIKKILVLQFLLSVSFSFAQNTDSLRNVSNSLIISKANKYKLKYKADCVQDKITDNRGNGFEGLYGTRNFRAILHGVAYRGGGNNYYHRSNKRNNKNPLPIDGLNNLLKNGFSTSVYLYNENFESAPKFLIDNEKRDTLHYYQLGGNNSSELDSILMFTYNAIINEDVGPVYLHCWNGWHQSGFVSAVLLKQFCGFNTTKSLHYWEDCADNWTRGYDRIRNAIRDFEPIEKYKIPKEISTAICPCYTDTRENDVVVNNNDELKSLKVEVKFPLNVSDLPPSVSTFLDEYANMLKENTYLSVEVGGYTDSQGEDSYNLILSEKRAKNVYDYLVAQGVDVQQISYKGYGEQKLKNKCSNGVRCSSALHSENRRIEFAIKKISYQINFNKNSYEISSTDKLILNDIRLMLSSDKNVIVEIGGHADKGTGTDFVNDNISHLRAESVFNYLKNNGLDMTNISYRGYGSSQVINNDHRDRRIEFRINESE